MHTYIHIYIYIYTYTYIYICIYIYIYTYIRNLKITTRRGARCFTSPPRDAADAGGPSQTTNDNTTNNTIYNQLNNKNNNNNNNSNNSASIAATIVIRDAAGALTPHRPPGRPNYLTIMAITLVI